MIYCSNEIDKKIIDNLKEIINDEKPYWSRAKDQRKFKVDKDVFLKNTQIPDHDVFTANNHNEISLDNYFFTESEKQLKLLAEVKDILGASSSTNAIMYYPKTAMKWHTNSNILGTRIYIVLNTKEGIFRYKDPFTGEIVDSYDNKGWTIRKFKISKDYKLWHTIWSEGRRFAFGFNIPD